MRRSLFAPLLPFRHVAFLVSLAWLAVPARGVLADPSPLASRVVARAREEVTRRVSYDPRYARIPYPNGDVDSSRGVCTDVVVRALRVAGIDLQALVHQDILARPRAYARFVARPDANIDHRRVGPLTVWLDAHATRLSTGDDAFAPGDLVVWSLHDDGNPDHIGLVSDRRSAAGAPLVVHNIGPTPTEEDVLHVWPLVGHWRLLRPL
jgi:uncharacterized protein YijF (DUF1287 family)